MSDTFAEGSNLIIAVIKIVDAAGNPTTLSTPLVWSSSDPTILNPVAAADGLSATGTLLQTGTVTVTATSGTISASVAITGIAGQAVSFQLAVSLAPAATPAAAKPTT